MNNIFKVNLETFKDEAAYRLFLHFIKSNKNSIKIINENKIKSLEKIGLETNKLNIKFLFLDNHFFFWSYKIKYKIRYLVYKDAHEEDILNKLHKEKIKIFGQTFVINNHSKCIIVYKNEIFPLQEYFPTKFIDYEKDNNLEIKLLSIKSISDFSYMFYDCKSLIDVEFYQKNIYDELFSNFHVNNEDEDDNYFINHKIDIDEDIDEFFDKKEINSSTHNFINDNRVNINDLSYIPYEFSSLKSLPDISKWNINNVNNMSYMFYGCSSLNSLPNISNWNTTNVTDMSGMFDGCSSLKQIPSKFNN